MNCKNNSIRIDDKTMIKLLTKQVKKLNAENKSLRRKLAELLLGLGNDN